MHRMLLLWSIQSSVLTYKKQMKLGNDIDRIMLSNSLLPEQDVANAFSYNDTTDTFF